MKILIKSGSKGARNIILEKIACKTEPNDDDMHIICIQKLNMPIQMVKNTIPMKAIGQCGGKKYKHF